MTDILNARRVPPDLFGHTPPERERKWLPAAYMDESVPPARATPTAWVTRLDDGTYALAGADDDDDYTNEDNPGEALTEGAVVHFQWTEQHGRAVIVSRRNEAGDGELYASPPQPPEANMVWVPGEHDSCNTSVADMIHDGCVSEGETVEYYTWSEPVPFIFRAGQFHPQEAAPNA